MANSNVAPPVDVYLRRNGGAWQFAEDYQCVECLSRIGSSSEPASEAKIIWENPGIQRTLPRGQDLYFNDADDIEIEVGVTPNEVDPQRIVHWGKVIDFRWRMDPMGDVLELTSKIMPHHFGFPLYETRYAVYDSGDDFHQSGPTIFNPEIKGRVVGNKSGKTYMDGNVTQFLFAHPSQLLTVDTKAYHGESLAAKWKLWQAVHYLCNVLNDSEQYILNPTADELQEVFDTSIELRNYAVPHGKFLPEILTALVEPYGYRWYVSFDAAASRKIRFLHQGDTNLTTLRLQRSGDDLVFGDGTDSADESEVEFADIKYDIATRTHNHVIVEGAYGQYEHTWELVRAWSADDDAASPDRLRKSALGDTETYHRVWREWVLNESGEYTDLRPEITSYADLSDVFTWPWILRRRRFLPPIHNDAAGKPAGDALGAYLEYYDRDLDKWSPISLLPGEWGTVRLLEDECGIRFDGEEIPLTLKRWYEDYESNGGTEPKLRITATIESDNRVAGQASDLALGFTSPLKDYHTLRVSRPERYKYRVATTSGNALTALGGYGLATEFNSSQQDDTGQITTDAERLLAEWNRATAVGKIVVFGANNIYGAGPAIDGGKLGCSLVSIQPREVVFTQNKNVSATEFLYPTVTEVRYDFSSQRTHLTLEGS